MGGSNHEVHQRRIRVSNPTVCDAEQGPKYVAEVTGARSATELTKSEQFLESGGKSADIKVPTSARRLESEDP